MCISIIYQIDENFCAQNFFIIISRDHCSIMYNNIKYHKIKPQFQHCCKLQKKIDVGCEAK